MNIDAAGFEEMIRKLKKKTGASYKDVVRGVTRRVLTNAAKKTQGSSAKKIKEELNKLLTRPFKVPNGDKIGITTKREVWYQGKGWKSNRWISLNKQGKLKNVGKFVNRTGKREGKKLELSPDLKSRINESVGFVKKFIDREKNYRLTTVHSSKASWLEIMRQLRMRPTDDRGLKTAMKATLQPKHKRSVRGFERKLGKESYEIVVVSRSQSALNKKARGIGAFALALNGQVKDFERQTGSDLRTYTQNFAKQNGFIVK